MVGATTTAAVPVQPVMYRWISTSKAVPGGANEDAEKRMRLSFSVPVSVTSVAVAQATMSGRSGGPDEERRGAKVAREAPCDVEGCTELRRYRLVRDWQRGACGMSHLKLLECRVE